MINRNWLVCDVCKTKVITRVAIGRGSIQNHKFNCPKCGIEISFILDLDQEKIDFSYRNPTNAQWSDSEDGSVEVFNFDPHTMIPDGLDNRISPFMASTMFYNSMEDMQRALALEKTKEKWIQRDWPIVHRLFPLFENKNDKLFDEQAKLVGFPQILKNRKERLIVLLAAQHFGLEAFVLTPENSIARVKQRMILAENISKKLVQKLADDYLSTDRLMKLWTELKIVRNGFIANYQAIAPLMALPYWKPHFQQDLSWFSLSDKRFDALRQVYIDCFETYCRLLVIAVGFETIIHERSLSVPTSKSPMTLWEFEGMKNGTKHTLLSKYPIADLFIPLINHKLRNGIGHNSAYYDTSTDEVIYRETRGDASTEHHLPYTLFCHELLTLYSAFELASLYYNRLLSYVAEKLIFPSRFTAPS